MFVSTVQVVTADDENKDSVYLYRFPVKNGLFYSPYKGNGVQLSLLFRKIDELRNEFRKREVFLKVDANCSSLTTKRRRRKVAYERACRVKSECITRKRIKEANFITHLHLGNGDGNMVIVRLYVPNDSVAKTDSITHYVNTAEPVESKDTIIDTITVVPSETTDAVTENKTVAKKIERYHIALKTNLLYDVAITPNLELEFPLGKRWSVNLEYQYAWWLHKQTFCWQIESGGIEGRYWLGDRYSKDVLQGWFIGAFTGMGMFDFQLKKKSGNQGDYYMMVGADAGYVARLSKHFNIEFSLGVGYLKADYKHYHVIDDILIKQGNNHNYNAFIPLKAKVSLSWMIGTWKKGGNK